RVRRRIRRGVAVAHLLQSMQIVVRQTVGTGPVERVFCLVNCMTNRCVDAVEEVSGGCRKVFHLYADAAKEPLNRSMIILPDMLYLVSGTRLLQAQQLLKLSFGLRAVGFWRGHEQHRQRHPGIGASRVGGGSRDAERCENRQRGQACPTAIWSQALP